MLDRPSPGLPGLRWGGADPLGSRLRPAALALQGLWAAVHPHRAARQAGGEEAGGGGPLLNRPVAARDRQAAGGVGPERAAVGRASCKGARPHARAASPALGGRARRDVALRRKKACRLWIWKALERAT